VVTIYTDGGSLGNPGPGGYGVVLLSGARRKELAGGFRRTTNNRMELMGAIAGLQALKQPGVVTLHSDSKYLVDAMRLGWARKWQANGWKRNKKERALNPDLWAQLLALCDGHDVTFRWLRGHAGHAENERCHDLAQQAMQRPDLPPDTPYEQANP
jgi:ribonuclease HI